MISVILMAVLSSHLTLCHACCSAGGNLVLQLSDCLTMFTADVLYLMARCFTSTTILKPFTSCLCSPERFLICYGKLGDTLDTVSYLHKVRTSS